MRLSAVVAVFLVSGGMALAQKMTKPVVRVPPAPGISTHSTVTPPPVRNSSADELTKIEQHTVRLRSTRPVQHHSSGGATAPPALDLGKNKPPRVTRPPQPASPNGH